MLCVFFLTSAYLFFSVLSSIAELEKKTRTIESHLNAVSKEVVNFNDVKMRKFN